MNFRTTSTIGEQMSHVKKYAPLLLLNIPRKYQYLLYSIHFFAIFAMSFQKACKSTKIFWWKLFNLVQ